MTACMPTLPGISPEKLERKLQISRRDTPRSKQEGRIRAKRARPCPKNVKKKPQRGLVYQNRDTQEREVLQSEAVSKKKSKRRGNAGWCIKLGTCEKKYRENLAQVVYRFGAVDGRAAAGPGWLGASAAARRTVLQALHGRVRRGRPHRG